MPAPRPQADPFRPSPFKHRPRFALTVEVKDEAEQKTLYERLRALGLKPKVVCV